MFEGGLVTPVSKRYRAIGADALSRLPQADLLPEEIKHAIRIVSRVLPFRVNEHVAASLIDWQAAPDDPIFRLVFPSAGMLSKKDFATVERLVLQGAPADRIQNSVNKIRARLNPHPSGQLESNVPQLNGEPLPGVQHKYHETVLYFPARGQTCHAYCTFCFRWAQFVGDTSLKFASRELEILRDYLSRHPAVSDILLTGGDPMIMSSRHITKILESICVPELRSVRTIRIGTKSLTFWPQRFVTDHDADELLRTIERVCSADRNVAVMAHINHWREIDNPIALDAIRRLRDAGAVLYSQAPLLAGINDDPNVWARNWHEQVKLGIHPYYMFVERDTGPRHYFEVPLVKSLDIYRKAKQQVSGLARSARGPVMSANPGKVEVLDVVPDCEGSEYLLQFLQARVADRVHRPFRMRGPSSACWFDELQPVAETTCSTS